MAAIAAVVGALSFVTGRVLVGSSSSPDGAFTFEVTVPRYELLRRIGSSLSVEVTPRITVRRNEDRRSCGSIDVTPLDLIDPRVIDIPLRTALRWELDASPRSARVFDWSWNLETCTIDRTSSGASR